MLALGGIADMVAHAAVLVPVENDPNSDIGQHLMLKYRSWFQPLSNWSIQPLPCPLTPIVAISDDILGAGLVSSLSHPEGNATGLTIMSPELSAKRLEVLQEMVPGMSRVAALWDSTTGKSQVAQTEQAARALNLNLQILEGGRGDDVVEAFRAARKGHADA